MLTLADILTSQIDCLHPDATLKSAFDALSLNNYSCCVIAKENKVPLGILTERDLVRLISEKSDSDKIMKEPLSDHMISILFTLPDDTTLEGALEWIESKKLRYLLVTKEDGAIAGIVTQTDMVKAYMKVMNHHSDQLENTIAKRTEQLEVMNKKLITLSLVDPLTGLGNRRAMEVDIMKVHASGIRHRRAYSVVLFDIDYFKKYNDFYGHPSGDKILESISAHLRRGIRESDTVYRYGGEEFLMLMPDTNVDEAMIPVNRIIEKLFGSEMAHQESPHNFITTSAGIASSHHQGQRLASWRQVVELADEGLYQAKHAGRNQACISDRSVLKAVN